MSFWIGSQDVQRQTVGFCSLCWNDQLAILFAQRVFLNRRRALLEVQWSALNFLKAALQYCRAFQKLKLSPLMFLEKVNP